MLKICVYFTILKSSFKRKEKGEKRQLTQEKKTILTQRYMFCLARYKTKMIDDILIVVCVA